LGPRRPRRDSNSRRSGKMPRAKGGSKTRQRRKKVLKKAKGYFGGRRKLYKTAAETVLRAGAFAYRGRKQKQRAARSLRIVRINAARRPRRASASWRRSWTPGSPRPSRSSARSSAGAGDSTSRLPAAGRRRDRSIR